MCRWLAYSGGSIFLDEALVKPEHSLIDQSLRSHSGATTTNGDGFGVGRSSRSNSASAIRISKILIR